MANVGVDVGGTRTKIAVLSPGGDVVATHSVDTPRNLAARIGPYVAELVEVAAKLPGVEGRESLGAVGIAVPGIVDEAIGVGVYSANLGWRDLAIVAQVRAATGMPVALGHDVRAGLVAEARRGAAAGATEALFLPLGTGIAGALMVGGRVVSASGWAGEVGHLVVQPGGPRCGCGARGCLEAVASASGIARAYAGLTRRTRSAAEVAGLVAAGDRSATQVWSVAIEALAQVIAAITAAAGTRVVVIGGGLSNSGETLLEPLRAAVSARLSVVEPPLVVRAALGDRAGSIGAAILAEGAR